MTKTETMYSGVSSEFKRRLAAEAAKEKRSITNYLEATLIANWERVETVGSQAPLRKPPK